MLCVICMFLTFRSIKGLVAMKFDDFSWFEMSAKNTARLRVLGRDTRTPSYKRVSVSTPKNPCLKFRVNIQIDKCQQQKESS
jgi:hypothetical protein